jgi:flagellar assembly protein FliH
MSSLPIAQIRAGSGFAADRRFAVFGLHHPDPAESAPPPDPVKDAFEQGFADGYAAARHEAVQDEMARDEQREAIELALARMDEQTARELAERLRQTVLALCEQAVLPLALDADGLAARIARAVAMLQRAQDDRRVLLHPDDLALVQSRLPAGLEVEGDSTVERGGLRIVTPDGGVEDGPGQWRRILAEAFREC